MGTNRSHQECSLTSGVREDSLAGDPRVEPASFTPLSAGEDDLLRWLGTEDFSQYGECYGPTLDALVSKGLAQIHGAGEHQHGFIAKGNGDMYRAVSLTEAGRSALKLARGEK